MKTFRELFERLDKTSRTSEKVGLLETYFRAAPPEDAAWALYFLLGNRLRRAVKAGQLREWAAEFVGQPLWMVEACYETVGDLAETLALLMPDKAVCTELSLATLVLDRLQPLAGASPLRQREILRQTWSELGSEEVFLWHKLITGGFRVGVAKGLVIRALSNVAAVEESVIATRLAGHWEPSASAFKALLGGTAGSDAASKPYPFFLASPLEAGCDALGDCNDWFVEWKWDGIRAQMVHRSGRILLWSRGEEVLNDGFPEIVEAASELPEGVVLDGELLAWNDSKPLGFAALQQRLNRKSVDAAMRRDVPVLFMAYDLLEAASQDLRSEPLERRRQLLAEVVTKTRTKSADATKLRTAGTQMELFGGDGVSAVAASEWLRLSELLPIATWRDVEKAMQKARVLGTEGVMLKRRGTGYGVGRHRGDWWKWKVDPFTCDVVLVGAQPGHGRRAGRFTDYTFAVWDAGVLKTIAKAYSGLTDEEIERVDAFVRANTTGQFGPVRSVKPALVFELAFEGIAPSSRHKSGLALRFPRIARWRHDKRVEEADSLETLRGILGAKGVGMVSSLG